MSVEEKLNDHWMPVGCAPPAWKFTFSATLPPGAPDPEVSASEACAKAHSAVAAIAHSSKSLLKNSRRENRLGFIIWVANGTFLL